jgi:hypothetical protein
VQHTVARLFTQSAMFVEGSSPRVSSEWFSFEKTKNVPPVRDVPGWTQIVGVLLPRLASSVSPRGTEIPAGHNPPAENRKPETKNDLLSRSKPPWGSAGIS